MLHLAIGTTSISKRNTYAYTRVASITLARTTTIISNKHPKKHTIITKHSIKSPKQTSDNQTSNIPSHHGNNINIQAKTHDNTMVASITHGKTTTTTTITKPSTKLKLHILHLTMQKTNSPSKNTWPYHGDIHHTCQNNNNNNSNNYHETVN